MFFTSYTNIPLQYNIYIRITSMLYKNRKTLSDLNTFYYLFSYFSLLKELMPITFTDLLELAVNFAAKCKS